MCEHGCSGIVAGGKSSDVKDVCVMAESLLTECMLNF
jgi:hypothetical protein